MKYCYEFLHQENRRTEFEIIENSKAIIGIFSNQKNQSTESVESLKKISSDLRTLSVELRSGFDDFLPTKDALVQPNWGTTYIEIPLLPITPKGVLFDSISDQASIITKTFLKTRNNSNAGE